LAALEKVGACLRRGFARRTRTLICGTSVNAPFNKNWSATGESIAFPFAVDSRKLLSTAAIALVVMGKAQGSTPDRHKLLCPQEIPTQLPSDVSCRGLRDTWRNFVIGQHFTQLGDRFGTPRACQ